MTNKNLYNAMNNIDTALIAKAAPTEKAKTFYFRKNNWIRWGVMAACFVLVICITLPFVLPERNDDILPNLDNGNSTTINNNQLPIDRPNDNGVQQLPIEKPNENGFISSGATDFNIIDPYRNISKNFTSCSDLASFLATKDQSFYFLNVDSTKTPYDFYNSISFEYEHENESNMYVEMSCLIYDESIGENNGLKDEGYDGTPISSYRILMRAMPFKYDGGAFEYKLYKYNDGVTMFDHVLYVYYKDQVVCTAYYNTTQGLTLNYWITLFENNQILIN